MKVFPFNQSDTTKKRRQTISYLRSASFGDFFLKFYFVGYKIPYKFAVVGYLTIMLLLVSLETQRIVSLRRCWCLTNNTKYPPHPFQAI